MIYYVAVAIVAAALGAAGLFAVLWLSGQRLLDRARHDADALRDSAKRESEAQAREQALSSQAEHLQARQAFDRELEADRRRMVDEATRLGRQEETVDRKLDTLSVKQRHLEEMERQLAAREKRTAALEQQLAAVLAEQRAMLLNLSGLSAEQAKGMLLRRIEDECRAEAGEIVRRSVEQANDEARDKSRQIIIAAIQRYASEQSAEHTTSNVAIPDDALKGRVIGREGRNIRSFEKATGVDVIIDDTPGLVVVSCFDPVRREVARISLEKLVQDGRIHPARIEEVVALTTKEMEESLVRIGREAAVEAQLPNLPKAVLPMLGRLHYRTSYGQNVLRHSMEVAYLSATIAAELGLDATVARRAGLLHDIGKAMDHEVEGGHPAIGMDFLRKCGESEAVLNAALAHHGDVQATTPYTPIVAAADAISASRPGARRESLERYIKRLHDLEDVALSFEGVRQAYAIQAGREVRVIVDAKLVDDKISAKIARDIAKKVEADLQYPGEIKITLIREVRSVEFAR
jgi:ribonuclease Y